MGTTTGAIFNSRAVILTAGTFLSGKLFIGRTSFEGGRIGELASHGLTEQLVSMGIQTARMKTGTPPRIDINSVDTSNLILQYGDSDPARFSYLPRPSAVQKSGSCQNQRSADAVSCKQHLSDILIEQFFSAL